MELPKPYEHSDLGSGQGAGEQTDEALHRDARAHLARWPQLQLVAELASKLRSLELHWWTPNFTRDTWRAATRMRWLRQRPDLRQQVTTQLTGLPKNAARNKSLEFQADLVDAVMDNGDVSAAAFETAFDPQDLVVYGPAIEFWQRFRDRMPWEDSCVAHQKLVAWLIRALLADRGGIHGLARRSILTPWDVRTAIDPMVWQTRLPVEIRVAVDEARLRQEKARPRDPYHARSELGVATPEVLTAHLPLVELSQIFALAERAMGFGEDGDAYEMPSEPPQLSATRSQPRIDLGSFEMASSNTPTMPTPPASRRDAGVTVNGEGGRSAAEILARVG